MAATLAPRAQEIGNDTAALGYVTGTWAPVERDFIELVGTVRPGGAGPAT